MKSLILMIISLMSSSGVTGTLTTITEENWREVLTGEWMVEL